MINCVFLGAKPMQSYTCIANMFKLHDWTFFSRSCTSGHF